MTIAIRIFAGLLVACLIAAGVGANIVWLLSTTQDPIVRAILVAIAIASAGYKGITPLYSWRRAGVLALPIFMLFAAALTFDVLAEMGFAAMTRGDKFATHDNAVVEYAKRKQAVVDADAAVKDLPAAPAKPARPASAITPLIESLKSNNGGCRTERQKTNIDCIKAATLEGERAAAEASDTTSTDAQKRIDDARVALKSARDALAAIPEPPASVDGQAAAIKRVLSPFVDISEAGAAQVFSVLLVAIVELGQIAGVYLTVNPPKLHKPAPVDPPTPRAGRRPNTAAEVTIGTLERILDGRLKFEGVSVVAGAIIAPQRKLAAALGVTSAPVAARVLAGLAAAGAIELSTGTGGTTIRLK